MSCPHLFDVAPYALGTLDPGERAGVAAHVADCADCQGVLESVAGLPGLLARVGPDAVEPDGPEPDDAMFQRLLARAQTGSTGFSEASEPADGPEQLATPPAVHRRAAPPRSRRWRTWAAASVAAAAVAVGTGTWVVENRAENAVHVVAASAGPVHAKAWLRPAGSGTDIKLELGGVAAEQRCSLVTVDRAGRRTVASTWEAGYPGTETFETQVALPITELTALRLETDQGILVTLAVD